MIRSNKTGKGSNEKSPIQDFIYNYQNDNMQTVCPYCKGIMVYPINEVFKFPQYEINGKKFSIDTCEFCKKKFKFEIDFSQFPDEFKWR